MHKVLKFLVVLVVVLFYGCNGDSGTQPSPTPTTTTTAGPSQAQVTLEVVDFALLASQANGALFGLEMKLQESAGLGCNINFIRLEVFRATGELEERREIGANEIANVLGDNRLEAGETWQEIVVFFFRATIKKGRELKVTVGLTDDRGNNIERWERFVFM